MDSECLDLATQPEWHFRIGESSRALVSNLTHPRFNFGRMTLCLSSGFWADSTLID